MGDLMANFKMLTPHDELQLDDLSKSPWLLNKICPYFTMFPIQYPVQILNDIEEATVFDPFCGRGTTLFAARMFGFNTYGIDNNPIAVAVSKAKLTDTTIDDIMEALARALDYDCKPEIPSSEFWQKAYNAEVLARICKIRYYLLNHDNPGECALRGIILGALHGSRTKNPDNASYLGNQMPRTYAPKPAYSLKFWNNLGLIPDNVDIKKIVKKRAIRYYESNISVVPNQVIYGDSRIADCFRQLPKVSVIITSPPYYGMQTYYTDQWIRNWFLGGPDNPTNALNHQFCHSSPQAFACELSKVWRNCATISQEKTKMFVRYGGISSRKVDPTEIFVNSIALTDGIWRILNIKDAGNSLKGKRQAVQMLSTTDKKSIPISEFDVEMILNA